MTKLLGYFDYPGQEVPTVDADPVCLACEQQLTEPMKTISLMAAGEEMPRSYFYRLHKVCFEEHPEIDEKAIRLMERTV